MERNRLMERMVYQPPKTHGGNYREALLVDMYHQGAVLCTYMGGK